MSRFYWAPFERQQAPLLQLEDTGPTARKPPPSCPEGSWLLSPALLITRFPFRPLIYILNAEYNCEEKVLSRTPECSKILCPNGRNGRPEEMFYECPKLPILCPMKISDDKAECCPDRCGKLRRNQPTKQQSKIK